MNGQERDRAVELLILEHMDPEVRYGRCEEWEGEEEEWEEEEWEDF